MMRMKYVRSRASGIGSSATRYIAAALALTALIFMLFQVVVPPKAAYADSTAPTFTVRQIPTDWPAHTPPPMDTIFDSGWTKASMRLEITDVVYASGTSAGHFGGYSFSHSPESYNWFSNTSAVFDRNQTVYVSVRNNLGEITQKEVEIYKIDRMPPIVRVDYKPLYQTGKWMSSVLVTVTGTDYPYEYDHNHPFSAGIHLRGYSFEKTAPKNEMDWSSWNSKVFTENGTHPVWVRDYAGNIGSWLIMIDNVDSKSPEASVELGPTSDVPTSGSVVATVSATDNVSGLHSESPYSWDGGETWTTSNTKAYAENGIYKVLVRDNALNWKTVDFTVSSIDEDAPVVPILTQGNYSPMKEDPTRYQVPLRWTAGASRSGETVEYRVFLQEDDGAYGSNPVGVVLQSDEMDGDEYEYVLEGLDPGTVYRVKVQTVSDGSAPFDSGGKRIFFDDMMPPTFKITKIPSPNIPSGWARETVLTIDDVADLGSGLHATPYCISTQSNTSWLSDQDWSVEPSRTIPWSGFVYLRVRDAAGNISTQSVNISMIDYHAPGVSIERERLNPTPDGWASGEKVTVTASDVDSGLPEEPYSFDGGTTWTAENTFTFTENSGYEEKDEIVIRDCVGNERRVPAEVTKIDNTPPDASVVLDPPLDTWTNSDVTVTTLASDDESGLHPDGAFKWDDDAEWTSVDTKTYSENGEYTLVVRSAVGLENLVEIPVLNIDKEAPTVIANVAPAYPNWGNADTGLKLDYAARDTGGSDVEGVYYSFDENAWERAGASPFRIPDAPEGEDMQLYVKARDKAGNESETTELPYKLDAIPPSASVSLDPVEELTTAVTATVKASDALSGLSDEPYSWDDGMTWTTEDTNEYFANGDYEVIVRDEAGNRTTLPFTISNIDKEAPTFDVARTPDDWTNGPVTLTIVEVTDGGGSDLHDIPYSFSMTPGIYNWSTDTSRTYDFNMIVYVAVRDRFDNIAVTTVVIDSIDKEAPTVLANTTPAIPNWGNTSTGLKLSYDANDVGASGVEGVYYSFDGSNWKKAGASPFRVPHAPEGESMRVHVKARDKAGNESNTETLLYKLDTTPPEVSVVLDPPLGEWTNGKVTAVVTISDDLSKPEGTSTFDGETWITTLKKIYTMNETYAVVARDKAGNRTVEPIEIGNIDKEVPILDELYTTPAYPAWGNAETGLILNYDASDADGSGVDSVYYSLDEKNWKKADVSPFKIPNALEGKDMQLHVKAADNAGNESDTKVLPYKLDTTLPEASVALDPPVGTWTKGGVTATVTASDAISGLAEKPYSWDGGVTWTTKRTNGYSENGDYVVKIRDEAGNVTEKTFDIRNIDKQAPAFEVAKSPDGWTNGSVTLTIVGATDADGSGLHDYAYSFSNNPRTYSWSDESSKTYASNTTVYVAVRDKVGNGAAPTPPKSVAVRNIDKIDPYPEPVLTLVDWDDTEQKATIYWTPSEDVLSGIKEYRVLLNDTPVATVQPEDMTVYGDYTYDFENLALGTYRVMVQAVDKADNHADSNEESFTVVFDDYAFRTNAKDVNVNLMDGAHRRLVEATSTHSGSDAAANAVDGNANTRWIPVSNTDKANTLTVLFGNGATDEVKTYKFNSAVLNVGTFNSRVEEYSLEYLRCGGDPADEDDWIPFASGAGTSLANNADTTIDGFGECLSDGVRIILSKQASLTTTPLCEFQVYYK